MTLTISPQIRLVALFGLLGVLGFAGTMMFLSHRTPSAEPVKHIVPYSQRAGHATAAPAPPAAKRRAKTSAKPHQLPAAKHVATVRPKPTPKPKPKPLANPYHLPIPLARALSEHPAVVVSLYSRESKVDTIAYAEARAGAAASGVGFVGLDVLDRAQVGNLTEQLGVLSDPGVLVYRRPGKLAIRLEGFVDRDTVAQAADNVNPHPGAYRPDWAARANSACSRFEDSAPLLPSAPSQAEFVAWASKVAPVETKLIQTLQAIPLPSDAHERVLARRLVSRWRSDLLLGRRGAAIVARSGRVGLSRGLIEQVLQNAKALDVLARELGATACGPTWSR